MVDDSQSYPVLEEFFTRGFGTLYVLRDSAFRLRDASSALALTSFFASRDIRLDVVPILATGDQRYLSRGDFLRTFPGGEALQEHIADSLRTHGDFASVIEELFIAAAPQEQHAGVGLSIAPRGPILVLGRPTLFPAQLQAALERELGSGRRWQGRFQMPDQPETAGGVRTIHDLYYNVTRTLTLDPSDSDFGVIRKVKGAFSTRSVLYAYGTSSLGTQAAAQVLTDYDQNEELRRRGAARHFAQFGEVEVLVEVKRRTPEGLDTASVLVGVVGAQAWHDLPPGQVLIKVGPDAPLSAGVVEAIKWLSSPAGDTTGLSEVYRPLDVHERPSVHGTSPVNWFEVKNGHPANGRATRLIGGRSVASAAAKVLSLIEQSLRAPILLVGPPGAGKELIARIAFESVAGHVLRLLALGRRLKPPIVVGTRFESFNCAALVETLAESLLFGIGKGVANDVRPYPGVILSAGEGVVFLDELSFLTPAQQGKLLRVLEDGQVRPTGHVEVPNSATIVAAMSEDPDELIHAGRLLPALFGRFRGRVVRLPAVSDRIADVPALLAAYSSRPIAMREFVLRALLASTFRSNVRDIQRVLARAELRQGEGEALEISIDDIGVDQDVPRSLDWPEGASERRFGFVMERPNGLLPQQVPSAFTALARAGRVLSSLMFTANTLTLRSPEASQLVAEEDATNFKDVQAAARHWIGTLGQLGPEELGPERAEEWLSSVLGSFARTRWTSHPEKSAFAGALCTALRPLRQATMEEVAGLTNARLAWSIGTDPSFISRLVPCRHEAPER